MSEGLTIDKLYAAMRLVQDIERATPLASIPVHFSDHVLKEGTERLFPESRHRSARIHKKLVKRHGGEFQRVPAIYKTPFGYVAHKSFEPAFAKVQP